MLRWRSTHVPRKSLSDSRIDIYIYNAGRDFGEVQWSAGPPRNTPEKNLGLLLGHINPRFSAICCHSSLSGSDRLCASVRTIKISDLRGALSQNFELCQTLRSLRSKGRLRRQACPCWLLLISIPYHTIKHNSFLFIYFFLVPYAAVLVCLERFGQTEFPFIYEFVPALKISDSFMDLFEIIATWLEIGAAGARKMYGLLAQGGFWRKDAQGIPPGVGGCLASDPGIRICSQIFPWNKGYGSRELS